MWNKLLIFNSGGCVKFSGTVMNGLCNASSYLVRVGYGSPYNARRFTLNWFGLDKTNVTFKSRWLLFLNIYFMLFFCTGRARILKKLLGNFNRSIFYVKKVTPAPIVLVFI